MPLGEEDMDNNRDDESMDTSSDEVGNGRLEDGDSDDALTSSNGQDSDKENNMSNAASNGSDKEDNMSSTSTSNNEDEISEDENNFTHLAISEFISKQTLRMLMERMTQSERVSLKDFLAMLDCSISLDVTRKRMFSHINKDTIEEWEHNAKQEGRGEEYTITKPLAIKFG